MERIPTYEEIKKVRLDYIEKMIQNWLHTTFLAWEWWILVFLTVAPFILWWKLLDRRRARDIILFGLVVGGSTGFFNDVGTGLMLWGYPKNLIPMSRIMMTPDFAIIPCGMMLVYQYAKSGRSFALLLLALSLAYSYIGEAFFLTIGVYELISWKLIYSVIAYNIIGHLARYIAIKVERLTKNSAKY